MNRVCRIRRIASLLLTGTACAAPPPELVSETRWDSIIDGYESDASHDAAIMLRVGDKRCTGALIAPNLFVTARHCLSEGGGTYTCTEFGQETSGRGPFGPSYPFDSVDIYLGNQFDPNPPPNRWAMALRYYMPDDNNRCTDDLALVLVDHLAAFWYPVDLNRRPQVDELLTLVGWGYTRAESAPRIRQQRDDVAVTRVGPVPATPSVSYASRYALPATVLSVAEGHCYGDSGGPAIDADGKLIGIVKGIIPATAGTKPVVGCLGTQAAGEITMISSFVQMVTDALTDAKKAEALASRSVVPGRPLGEMNSLQRKQAIASIEGKWASSCSPIQIHRAAWVIHGNAPAEAWNATRTIEIIEQPDELQAIITTQFYRAGSACTEDPAFEITSYSTVAMSLVYGQLTLAFTALRPSDSKSTSRLGESFNKKFVRKRASGGYALEVFESLYPRALTVSSTSKSEIRFVKDGSSTNFFSVLRSANAQNTSSSTPP